MKYWFLDAFALEPYLRNPSSLNDDADDDRDAPEVLRVLARSRKTGLDILYTSPLADIQLVASLRLANAPHLDRITPLLDECNLNLREVPIDIPDLRDAQRIITDSGVWFESAIFQVFFNRLVSIAGTTATICCVVADPTLANNLEGSNADLRLYVPGRDHKNRFERMMALPS